MQTSRNRPTKRPSSVSAPLATARSARTSFSTSRKLSTLKSNDLARIQAQSHINAELSARTSSSRTSYSKVPTRISQLNLKTSSRSLNIRSRGFETKSDEDQEENENVELSNEEKQIFITFDLLQVMNHAKIMKYVTETPIFLRTLFIEGKLDSDIIGKIALSLSQSELLKFIHNMTTEMSFFSSIQTLDSIASIEERIPTLVPIQKLFIWTKMENAPYLTSPSLNSVLPIDETVCGVPFNEPKDYNIGDPGDFTNFSVNYDLPLVRGTKSMLLLPITNVNNDVVAVVQCIGLRSDITEEQIEFTNYYLELFKIVRDLIQKKFFESSQQRVVPSTVSSVFQDVTQCSTQKTAQLISNYFMKTIPCEQCDLFEFDDRYRKLIRLSDGQTFDESSGGVSFAAGITPGIINIPHGQTHKSFNREIDGHYANLSILSRSMQQGRSHYVITLRAKPNVSSFSNDDAKLVIEMNQIVCDALKVAKFAEDQQKRINTLTKEKSLMMSTVDIIANIAAKGTERYKALVDTAKLVFGAEHVFVCAFDGRYMRYFPTQVKAKFEDCASGQAYNYRETVWTDESEPRPKYSPMLYDQLKVKRKTSVCFPYRANGRVVGAIELINPERKDIEKEEEKLFGNICGALVHEKFVNPQENQEDD